MKVFSIFDSVSGEIGLVPQGIPMRFLRLSYCNLRCGYCDAAESLYESEEMSVEEVSEQLTSDNWPQHLLITGGEPLLQTIELDQLLPKIRHRFETISIETNGILTSKLFNVDCYIVDVKCPCSGNIESNLTIEQYAQDMGYWDTPIVYKAVVGSEEDLNFADEMFQGIRDWIHPDKKIVFAMSALLPLTPAEVWQFIRDNKRDYVLNTQIHKIIWEDKDPDDSFLG